MDQRPTGYPKASDLVNRLIEDVRAVLVASTDEDIKSLKEKFHTSVRAHRHKQERFGKKWKRALPQAKTGKSRFWA